MNLNLVFLLVLSALASGLLSYYQYFFKKEFERFLLLPAFFRFIAIFCLLLLLINPRYQSKQSVIVKPELLVAWDASRSMGFSGAEVQVKEVIDKFHDNRELNDQFEIQYFGFGESLRLGDSLSFSSGQTDIDRALKQLNQLSSSDASSIVLVSDGIQTVGRNYAYAGIDRMVFPIIVGDTVQKNDLEISQVNANAYVTMGNLFEVEAFVTFSGKGSAKTELRLEKEGQLIDRKSLKFNEKNRSQRVKFELPSDEPGQHMYRIHLIPFPNELETLNNQEFFEVEVVNSQMEIAVIYAFAHPDLGMIKQSLEREKRKEVKLIHISEWSPEDNEFSVHILYQPDDRFRELFSYLKDAGKNYFLIAGASSDWNFLNSVQESFRKREMMLSEEAYPVFAEEFQSFYQEDPGFQDFPSLRVNLGEVDFKVSQEPVLWQSINGIESGQPMLTVYQEEGARRVALFGEGIWKWRAFVFQRDQKFERFDRFFDALIQYLYLTERKQTLELFYDKTNFDDQRVVIQARKYDSNLNLDLSAPLELRLDGVDQAYPMYVNNGYYEIQLGDLDPGHYTFGIEDPSTGAMRSGNFEVVSYSAEQMTLTSDVSSMTYLAEKTEGKVFYPSQMEEAFAYLIDQPDFKPVEKIEKKLISGIDQKWLLALIVLSLSIEWIIRKYRGLV